MFSLEKFITNAGLEVKIDRRYYYLAPAPSTSRAPGSRGQVVEQQVEKYDRRELKSLAELKSGDLVEVELIIDSKNDYEYVLIEDRKAAGFEPVAIRSGYGNNGLNSYRELRDEKVCFFVHRLPRGKHNLRYRLRAEIPGKFSALPARAEGMYAPDLRANSDEMKLNVID
jgi:uncharacterized protein YfaS (alpha-2-macroglobulin family)